MEAQDVAKTGLFAILKHPIVLGIIILVASIFGFMIWVGTLIGSGSNNTSGNVMCQGGDINREVYDAKFDNAGAFAGKSDEFIQAARNNQIDPVLFAAIAFHETGAGNSKMVRERNNPGGLYNSNTNSFFVYDSLATGLDEMASNLYRLYISEGLFTIEDIGNKYAPIGVANDPTNLNAHWIPTVKKLAVEFGGLSMNCESIVLESGFARPLSKKLTKTSDFGMRYHPIQNKWKLHGGIDFGCNASGDNVLSAKSGTASVNFDGGGWGNYVIVSHGDGMQTLYAHMWEAYVTTGETVEQGQAIGECGSSGGSTGPHLHLELHINGKKVDPAPYFLNQSGGEE